jgi:DNA-binding MarR family transcriptional regulator
MNAAIRPPDWQATREDARVSIVSVKPDVVGLGRRGRVLGTRRLGEELADLIRKRAAGNKRPVVIDFKGVEVASSPVLDEIARALRAAIADYPDRFVVLANLNEDVRDTMLLVLESRDMSLTTVHDDTLELLGGRAHLEETLAQAQELGTFTAAELAERLKVKLPNLHHRLNELQAAGAVARVETPAGRSRRAIQFATPNPRELTPA